MIPFIRIFSLFVRVFARPLINRTKSIHLRQKFTNKHHYQKQFFIWLGNKYHTIDTKINKQYLELANEDFFIIQSLSDDHAIEKGVEFFWEIVFYSLLSGIPLYEMYQIHLDASIKA